MRQSGVAEALGLVGGPALVSAVTSAAARAAGWDLVADAPAKRPLTAGQQLVAQVGDLAGQLMLTEMVARETVELSDDDDSAAALTGLAQSRAALDGLLVTMVVRAVDRSAPSEVGLTMRDWLAVRCPWLSTTEINDLATVAQAIATGGVVPSGTARCHASVGEALRSGTLSLPRAARVVRTAGRVRPVFGDDLDGFTELVSGLVALAVRADVTDRELREMCDEVVSRALRETERKKRERLARELRGVSEAVLADGEVVRFTITTDKEGAERVRSVIHSPLAAPRPDANGRDTRSATQRRHDALMTVLGRGVASAAGVPQTSKAKVLVTIDWQVLLGLLDGHGLTGSGQIVSASMARKMACGAKLVPAVLGSDSAPLDLGRAVRLATPAQVAALWLRDKGCTFPGCTVPPGWCDAHHLVWFSRGGRTDLRELALLCEQHHTLVHDKDVPGEVVDGVVRWHL